MAKTNIDDWKDLDITNDEMKKFSEALKKEEFRKMFLDYCEEIQDPKNKKLYEEEITQLENERGIDITFINPEPGYVIKTSVNGESKAFINVAQSDKVEKPKSVSATENNQSGFSWQIPYTQAPPRRDIDRKGGLCTVYDVVFHPDALELAKKDKRFRKIVTDTACDAVQETYKVQIDKVNLKFPKMKFKGTARPTVIRKKNIEFKPDENLKPEDDPLNGIYPPLNEEKENKKPKPVTPKPTAVPKYAIPKYTITHRRNVEYHEMTDELDAKLNVTIPKELIVSIDLPLLKTTDEVQLDVTKTNIFLLSERKDAKYKLEIKLPYSVDENDGSAKFDKSTRKLVITLPVSKSAKTLNIHSINEVLEKPLETAESVPVKSEIKLKEQFVEEPEKLKPSTVIASPFNRFLDSTISYACPTFTCNQLDNTVAFTIHIKNIDPTTVSYLNEGANIYLKFSTLGKGYFNLYYALFIKLLAGDANSSVTIENVSAEAWDNNLILQLEYSKSGATANMPITQYEAGLDEYSLTVYDIIEDCGKVPPPIEEAPESQEKLDISVSVGEENDVCIEIKKASNPDCVLNVSKQHCKKAMNRKKFNKKRSLSESYCDEMRDNSDNTHSQEKQINTEIVKKNTNAPSKMRSMSECTSMDDHTHIKGILKNRNNSYQRDSISESSVEDHNYSVSIDTGMGSFDQDNISDSKCDLSESCKKTVRFNDMIKKQIFR